MRPEQVNLPIAISIILAIAIIFHHWQLPLHSCAGPVSPQGASLWVLIWVTQQPLRQPGQGFFKSLFYTERSQMFIAALFKIVRRWKQPTCLSTFEGIKKMCYICRVEYYKPSKGIEYGHMLQHGGTSKTMLSKRKQTHKVTCCMIPCI